MTTLKSKYVVNGFGQLCEMKSNGFILLPIPVKRIESLTTIYEQPIPMQVIKVRGNQLIEIYNQ